jgi:hypothetical protein
MSITPLFNEKDPIDNWKKFYWNAEPFLVSCFIHVDRIANYVRYVEGNKEEIERETTALFQLIVEYSNEMLLSSHKAKQELKQLFLDGGLSHFEAFILPEVKMLELNFERVKFSYEKAKIDIESEPFGLHRLGLDIIEWALITHGTYPYTNKQINEVSKDRRKTSKDRTTAEIAFSLETLFGVQLNKLTKDEKIEILHLITGRSGNDVYQNMGGKNLTPSSQNEIRSKLEPIKVKMSK